MMKLWDKGYELNHAVESFTVGNDPELDQELVYFDCLASKAHAASIHKAGILSDEELEAIKGVLDEIIALSTQGKFQITRGQEDCHTAIEQYLTDKLGETGKKIHTARSRNDQVLTALRLYYKLKMELLLQLEDELIQAIMHFKHGYGEIEFPGYTHMQKAMPTSFAVWAAALVDSMEDNRKMLKAAFDLLDQSPLGTAAGYGVPLDIDRALSAELMGFSRVQKNPIYAQHSRGKFEVMLIQTLALFTTDLNKLASDLILFNMAEFSFVHLPKEFCTGSSIMPQKKNPDVLELLRAKHHVVTAAAHEIASISANLISGYNRDLQLTKEPVMRAVETTLDSMHIAVLLFKNLQVNEDACDQAMTSDLYATEQAYALVEQGVPFREAYQRVAEDLKKGQ